MLQEHRIITRCGGVDIACKIDIMQQGMCSVFVSVIYTKVINCCDFSLCRRGNEIIINERQAIPLKSLSLSLPFGSAFSRSIMSPTLGCVEVCTKKKNWCFHRLIIHQQQPKNARRGDNLGFCELWRLEGFGPFKTISCCNCTDFFYDLNDIETFFCQLKKKQQPKIIY